jgi:hypothetical protein
LAALTSFLLALCRNNRKQLFAVHATSLLTMQVPYCAYHLLSAAAIFRAEINAAHYIVLSQADYFFVMVLSATFLRREVVLNQMFAAILGLLAIFLFLFISFDVEGSAMGSCTVFGCFQRHRPSMDEWKGVWLVLGARVCYVLCGVLSKRLLLWQARQDVEVGTKKRAKKANQVAVAPAADGSNASDPSGPAADANPAASILAVANSNAEGSSSAGVRAVKGGVLKGIGLQHPGSSHLFFAHGTGGSDSGKALMSAMQEQGMLESEDGHHQDLLEASKRFWLYLTRLDQVFDSMTFDTEYFGTTMSGTMDLHQMGGSIALLPVALVAAYIDGEFNADASQGTDSFWEDLKDMKVTQPTSVLLMAMAVAHLLRPMSLSRVVMGHSDESYTAMRMVAMVLCLIWVQMYMSEQPYNDVPSMLLASSMPITHVLAILMLCVSSAWFVTSSVALKKRAVLRSSVQQIVMRFQEADQLDSNGSSSNGSSSASASASAGAATAAADEKPTPRSRRDAELAYNRADLLDFVRSMDAVDRVLGRDSAQRLLLDVALAAHTSDVRTVSRRQRRMMLASGDAVGGGGDGRGSGDDPDDEDDDDDELISGGGPRHVGIAHVMNHFPLLAAEPLVSVRGVFPPMGGGNVGALVRGGGGIPAQVAAAKSLARLDPSALAGVGREREEQQEEQALFERQKDKMGFLGYVDDGGLSGEVHGGGDGGGDGGGYMQGGVGGNGQNAPGCGVGYTGQGGVSGQSQGMYDDSTAPLAPLAPLPVAYSPAPLAPAAPHTYNAETAPALPPYATPNGMGAARARQQQGHGKATDSVRKPSPALQRVTLPPLGGSAPGGAPAATAAPGISAAMSSFYDAAQDTDDEDEPDDGQLF